MSEILNDLLGANALQGADKLEISMHGFVANLMKLHPHPSSSVTATIKQ